MLNSQRVSWLVKGERADGTRALSILSVRCLQVIKWAAGRVGSSGKRDSDWIHEF